VRIVVKAKTRAKEEKVERISQPTLGLDDSQNKMIEYKVWVKEAPVDGKANEAIAKALAKYFDVSKSQVSLVSGATSKNKVFEIND